MIVGGYGLKLLDWKLLQFMATPYMKDAWHSFCLHQGEVIFSQQVFVKDAARAAKLFIQRKWVDIDQYGNYRLNDLGKAQAKAIPEPAWMPPAAPRLIDRDFKVLCELDNRWRTPFDCGGTNGSYHSASLTKLTHHGYAECEGRGGKIVTGSDICPRPHLRPQGKGSRRFRITEAGKRILEEMDLNGPRGGCRLHGRCDCDTCVQEY